MSETKAKLILQADNSDYKKKLKEAETSTDNLDKSIDKTAKTAERSGDAFANLGKYISGLSVVIATKSIKDFADYDLQMKKVKAISGATAEEFELLKNKARELGGATSFTAVQAGEAFEALSRMGVSAKQTMEMTGDVLLLAEGQMLDLARASEIVNTTLITFSKEGINAKNVVDRLTTASNSSNNSVESLAGALKAGGVVASEANVSMNETIAVFMKMAEAGKKGEEAGTALRNILINLMNPNAQAQKAFADMNIQVYNTDGTMRNFFEIIKEMKTAFKELTDQEKDNYGVAIAGRENYVAFKTLMSETGETLEKYKEKLDGSTDSAKKQVDELEGLSKQWTLFKSAISETGLQIGEFLEGDGYNLLTWATGLVNELNQNLTPALEKFGKYFGENIYNEAIASGIVEPEVNRDILGPKTTGGLLYNIENTTYKGGGSDYYKDYKAGTVDSSANEFWNQNFRDAIEENNRLLKESNNLEKKKLTL